MAVATHLADKSALARLQLEPVARRLGPMIEAGLVGTCGIIELEVRYSARSHPEYEAVADDRRLGYEWFPMPDDVWDRALDIQHELSARGELRAVKFPDLLIAATAERHAGNASANAGSVTRSSSAVSGACIDTCGSSAAPGRRSAAPGCDAG